MPESKFEGFTNGLFLPCSPDANQEANWNAQGGLAIANNVEFSRADLRGRRGSISRGSIENASIQRLHRFYPRGTQPFPVGPNSGASNTILSGGAPWSSIGSSTRAKDSIYSSVDLLDPDIASDPLLVSGFGFDIPNLASSEITGIEVRITRNTQSPFVKDLTIQLVTPIGDGLNLARSTVYWPTGDTLQSYGGAGYLWGFDAAGPSPLEPSHVNDPSFGVRIILGTELAAPLATANIDLVEIIVYGQFGRTVGSVDVATIAATQSRVGNALGVTLRYHVDTGDGFVELESPDGATLRNYQRPTIITWPERDSAYIFDGGNPVFVYNGARLLTLERNGELEPPRGPYAALWRNRLFATKPDEIAYSVYASAVNDPANWPANAQLSVNDPSGGEITGIVDFGDRLLIFKENSIWAFQGDIQYGGILTMYCDTVGCVAPDTLARTPFGVIFLGRDGLYMTDGAMPAPVELSHSVRPLFDRRTATTYFSGATGIYYARKEQYWLFLNDAIRPNPGDRGAKGGRVLNSTPEVYVLHRMFGEAPFAWTKFDGLTLEAPATFDGGEDNGILMVGDQLGIIREWDVSDTDDGFPIPIRLKTFRIPIDTSPFMREGRVYHVKPFWRGATKMDGIIRYDHEINAENTDAESRIEFSVDAITSPQIRQTRTTIVDQSKWGRWVDIELRSEDGPYFELFSVTIDTKLKAARLWR